MRLYPTAVDKYLSDPTSGVNTQTSKVTYRKTLRALAAEHPDKQLDDYTENDLVDFCSKTHLSPATRAGYQARIRGFFSWAAWRGLVDVDPSVNLKRVVKGASFTRPSREHHWLAQTDVARVFDSIDTSTTQGRRSMVIARLGFTVGLRRAEIADLRWSQVDLERQQIHMKGKGGKLASVYITDTTLPWLDKWRSEATAALGREPADELVVPKLNMVSDFQSGYECRIEWDRPVKPDAVGKTVRAISDGAGIDFAPHDMRRSFAGMLEENGAPVEEISAALRHTNIGTTQRYLERRQDAAFRAVKGRGLDV